MALPSRFGRYQVLEPLGQGAMGAVYKARDPDIDRFVAVKTLGAAILAVPEHRSEFLARFRQEARAAGRLSHPHIVSVFDVGVEEATQTPFIVMEYVAGVSLGTVLHENPTLPLSQALEILGQVGSALEEAHRQGIVHRDIKPGNIFLDTRGSVKVGDFGIARIEGSDLTQTGVGLGTPGYSAPEVVRGGTADARADVFALGALAYCLLSGRKPFQGATAQAIGIDVLQREPDPPVALRPEIPPHTSDAVMRALAKDPAQRTPSAAAFLEDLRGSETTLAGVVPPPASGWRWLLVGALTLAAIVLGALWAFWPERDRAQASTTPAPVSHPARPATTPTPNVHPPVTAPAWPAQADDGQDEPRDKRDNKGRDDPGRSHGKGKKKGHGP
jgi:serine/threonine-protein kinase